MRAVGVPNTYTEDELLEAGADAIVGDLATFTPAWIESRFASYSFSRPSTRIGSQSSNMRSVRGSNPQTTSGSHG